MMYFTCKQKHACTQTEGAGVISENVDPQMCSRLRAYSQQDRKPSQCKGKIRRQNGEDRTKQAAENREDFAWSRSGTSQIAAGADWSDLSPPGELAALGRNTNTGDVVLGASAVGAAGVLPGHGHRC